VQAPFTNKQLEGVFVKETCLRKLCWNPTSSLTYKSWTGFFCLKLWQPFCAAKLNMLAIYTTRHGTVYSSEVSLKYHQQFDLWKPEKLNANQRTDRQMAKTKTILGDIIPLLCFKLSKNSMQILTVWTAFFLVRFHIAPTQ
jgi:hypothetical protein